MVRDEYEIRLYTQDFEGEVAEVLADLWGSDKAANTEYFRWKYVRNPHADAPLGIVALKNSHVVAFRGYFAARFVGGSDHRTLTVLRPGDTCVHRHHRSHGLSVQMGKVAMHTYAERYPLFLNLTCNRASLPGYLKLGFTPLGAKYDWQRGAARATLRRFLPAIPAASLTTIEEGRFGVLDVSRRPRPATIAALSRLRRETSHRFSLDQDVSFLEWRYQNPRGSYVFYFLIDRQEVDAYVVIGLSEDRERGDILDFGGKTPSMINEAIKHAIRLRHFSLYAIPSYSVDKDVATMLRKRGFSSRPFTRVAKRLLHGELPVLIRSVRADFAAPHLMHAGLDLRRLENWELRAICSDAT